ncbi:MAG: hypothetical protein ACLFTY_02575 [Candidatus Aenigmatarchaeota archaeon]
MNIFVLDLDPEKCARFHTDRHVNKMLIESAQMLSTAHHVSGSEAPYKKTHVNHPCNLWTRESIENYDWLLSLAENLLGEYNHRYGNKVHETARVLQWLQKNKPDLPSLGVTDRPMAMPDNYARENVVESYRRYYVNEKTDGATWTDRPKPHFVEDSSYLQS